MVTATHMQLFMNNVSTSVMEAYKPKRSKESFDMYLWLDPDDPQRHMMDEEILHMTIDLSISTLDENGKKQLMTMIIKT